MITKISFKGAPSNFHIIDSNTLRSAQPDQNEFLWLKKQGVTDVINFRTYKNLSAPFDEKSVVTSLGMNYHSISSETAHPKIENVKKFLGIVNDVKARKGKVLFHCYHGSDRTGMYALIYHMKNGMGSFAENVADMCAKGFNQIKYPHLIEWVKKCLKVV